MDHDNKDEIIPGMSEVWTIRERKKISIRSFPITSFYSNEDFNHHHPAAIITGFVKNKQGEREPGIMICLRETGACAKSDHEGRYTLLTQVTGSLHVDLMQQEHLPPATTHGIYIPPTHEGITIHVPDFILTTFEKAGK